MVEQALMQVAWCGGFAKVIRVVDIHTTKYDKVVGPMKHVTAGVPILPR
jgi:L-alanine-DL-glutamate epimerase-like enolase superfamily enzyme